MCFRLIYGKSVAICQVDLLAFLVVVHLCNCLAYVVIVAPTGQNGYCNKS